MEVDPSLRNTDLSGLVIELDELELRAARDTDCVRADSDLGTGVGIGPKQPFSCDGVVGPGCRLFDLTGHVEGETARDEANPPDAYRGFLLGERRRNPYKGNNYQTLEKPMHERAPKQPVLRAKATTARLGPNHVICDNARTPLSVPALGIYNNLTVLRCRRSGSFIILPQGNSITSRRSGPPIDAPRHTIRSAERQGERC